MAWSLSIFPASSRPSSLLILSQTLGLSEAPIPSSNTCPTPRPIFSFLTISNYVFMLFCSFVLLLYPLPYLPSANIDKPAPTGLSWSWAAETLSHSLCETCDISSPSSMGVSPLWPPAWSLLGTRQSLLSRLNRPPGLWWGSLDLPERLRSFCRALRPSRFWFLLVSRSTIWKAKR